MKWDSPPSQPDTSQLFPLTRAAGRFVNTSLTFANDIVKLALTSRHFFVTSFSLAESGGEIWNQESFHPSKGLVTPYVCPPLSGLFPGHSRTLFFCQHLLCFM